MSDLFREKSLERISSPEKLDDYIKVTTPSVWLVLAATVTVLIGIIVWSVFGSVNEVGNDGSTKSVHPVTFVTN